MPYYLCMHKPVTHAVDTSSWCVTETPIDEAKYIMKNMIAPSLPPTDIALHPLIDFFNTQSEGVYL